MWVKNCIKHRLSLMGGDSYRNALLMIKGCYPQQRSVSYTHLTLPTTPYV